MWFKKPITSRKLFRSAGISQGLASSMRGLSHDWRLSLEQAVSRLHHALIIPACGRK